MRKIGIQTDDFFGRKNYDEFFELMNKCGFDCIDYAGALDPASELGELSLSELEAKMREMRRAADKAGIEIYQMHGPWTWPIPNATTEERKVWTEFAKKCIIASAELGSPRYVVHPIMPFGPSGEEDREVYLAENRAFLTTLCETAKEVGSVICLENMPFVKQSLYTPCHMRDFIKEIPYDNIAVCLDTGHALYVGLKLEDSVRELGSCIQSLHVHDNFTNGDQHLMPFTAKGDWDGFSKALRECVPESVPLILETEPPKVLPTCVVDHFLKGFAMVAEHIVNIGENNG